MDKLHFKDCKKIPIFNVEDDGNINPYATFNQMKQVIMEKEQQSERDKSPDLDDISLQKLEAQKAVCLLFVPFYQHYLNMIMIVFLLLFW